jgi:MFS transporter, putative metabolite:H+ symporter
VGNPLNLLRGEPEFTPYQRKLFFFISIACFFEGFDFYALSQILPQLQIDMGLDDHLTGWLVAIINVGTILAYALVRRADQWGRKRVLTITIVGYTVFTFLTALSPNIGWFIAFQLIARIFLIGEWATSMVIAAEEFPAERRGMAIGVVSGMATFGSIVCAGVVPLLLKLSLGPAVDGWFAGLLDEANPSVNFRWRYVYLIGIVPLLLLMYARRGLRETQRFEATRMEGSLQTSLFAVLRSPYKKRILQMSAVWTFTYISTQTGVMFWKLFVVRERGWPESDAGNAMVIAALVALPLVFLAGKLIDVVGRRVGATVIFSLGALGFLGCYTLHGFWPLTLALMVGIFCVSAVLPVLNAYTTELFPTEFRADAFAWSNNLLGRVGYVLAPAGVGLAAASVGWGPAVASTVVGLVIALGLILWWLPETKQMNLEQTAALQD